MARKGTGSVWNKFLNVVGLVDVDEEPQRSNANSYEEDRYGYGGQRGYTPTARRNDRPQQSTRRTTTGSYSSSARQSDRSSASSRSSSSASRYGAQDSYSEWNTAPRSTNRYANSIYDDDTTIRGGVEGRDDNNYISGNYRSSGSYSSRDNGYRTDSRSTRRRVEDDFDTLRDDRYEDDFNSARTTRRSSARLDDDPDERRPAVVEHTRRSHSGEVVVYDIRVLEDCRDVIYALLANKTVVFTVEEMDTALIRRVVDTLCGAACALDATIRKTSDVSFLIAPSSVEVNGTRRSVEHRY